ncbi:MAG: hypothetical protein ACRD35_06720 [Candidatus Acidiferrales bacterium]
MNEPCIRWAAGLLLAVSLLLAGCSTGQAPPPRASAPAAKPVPPPPPPPPPPKTSLGKLVKVERSPKAKAQVLSLNAPGGIADVEESAGKGKVFLVLHFEGEPSEEAEDNPQWLSDAAGKKYDEPFAFGKSGWSELAYEIPADATGLIWHDGKKAYELEPHPKLLEKTD